jgi:hypothetical protein
MRKQTDTARQMKLALARRKESKKPRLAPRMSKAWKAAKLTLSQRRSVMPPVCQHHDDTEANVNNHQSIARVEARNVIPPDQERNDTEADVTDDFIARGDRATLDDDDLARGDSVWDEGAPPDVKPLRPPSPIPFTRDESAMDHAGDDDIQVVYEKYAIVTMKGPDGRDRIFFRHTDKSSGNIVSGQG